MKRGFRHRPGSSEDYSWALPPGALRSCLDARNEFGKRGELISDHLAGRLVLEFASGGGGTLLRQGAGKHARSPHKNHKKEAHHFTNSFTFGVRQRDTR